MAGALGPTSRTASLSPDVNDPGYRNTGFEELRETYGDCGALSHRGRRRPPHRRDDLRYAECQGGAVCDRRGCFDEMGVELPVIVSGTITDASGRTLSGQTVEAFWNSIRHARPLAVGLELRARREAAAPACRGARAHRGLLRCARTRMPACPTPSASTKRTAAETASQLGEWATSGLVNIVGGCCGTTPDHIAHIARAVAGVPPRKTAAPPRRCRLSRPRSR